MRISSTVLAQREKILLMVKEHFSVVGYFLMQYGYRERRERRCKGNASHWLCRIREYNSGTEGGESIDANITSLTGKPPTTHEASVAVARAFSADTGPRTL